MAAVSDQSHPLRNKICTFLGGCPPVAVTHTLTVASTNPNSGVNITVSPADNNGSLGGNTLLTLTYNDGTAVTLTAPPTAGGNNFSNWTGCDSTSGTTCTVTINSDLTVAANYVTPVPGMPTLTVASTNPSSGAGINVSPSDNNGQGNGTTQFTRTYNNGVVVSLGARSDAGGNNFSNWTGCDSTSGTACTVTMNADRTVVANYVRTSPDNFAYLVNGVCDVSFGFGGCVSIYTIDPSTGALTFRGAVGAGSDSIAMAVDPFGKFAYVVNRGSTDVSMYTIDPTTGSLTPIAACPINPVPVTGGLSPFSIAIHPSGNFAYVLNGGNDPIFEYMVDRTTGCLTQTSSVTGGGPLNSIAIQPSGSFVYVADGTFKEIDRFAVNQTTGVLTLIDSTPIDGSPSGVVLHPSGSFAYALLSSLNKVLVFTIDATGKVIPAACSASTGSGPVWPVVIDPLGKFAYVRSGVQALGAQNITVYTVDLTTGCLTNPKTFDPEPVGIGLDWLTLERSDKFAYVVGDSDLLCPLTSSLVSISAFTIDRSTGLLTPSGKLCTDFSGGVVVTWGPSP